ncbi:hypothetical protein U1Q18_034767, partial [Sarracenia purpurea var. burkii]
MREPHHLGVAPPECGKTTKPSLPPSKPPQINLTNLLDPPKLHNSQPSKSQQFRG